MKMHKEHRIECSVERFYALMFDPDFERRMNLEAMDMQAHEVLERDVASGLWRMRCRMTPKDNMPAFLKKLLGASFSLEETMTHEKGSGKAQVTLTPSALRDKSRMGYTMQVVPEGEGACRRIMDWDLEIKIFGIGGQVEKFALGEIEKGVEASARFMNAELKKA